MFFFFCCVLLSVYFPRRIEKLVLIFIRESIRRCANLREKNNDTGYSWRECAVRDIQRIHTDDCMHNALHSVDFASYSYTLWVMILFNKLVNKSLLSQLQDARPSARANIEMLLMLPRSLVSMNLHRGQAEMYSKCYNEWYRYWLLKESHTACKYGITTIKRNSTLM